MSDDGHLSHGSPEHGGHLALVGDKRLPEARGTRVTGEVGVGEETHFTDEVTCTLRKRRVDFSYIPWSSRNTSSTELSLEEELCVELPDKCQNELFI